MRGRKKVEGLTPREKEVCDLLARGFNYRGIAEQLNLKKITIQKHAESAMKKLNAKNCIDLTITYYKEYVAKREVENAD